MLTQELKAAADFVFRTAKEKPNKYVRIVWTHDTQIAVIKGVTFSITRVLLVCKDENGHPTIWKSEDGQLHLLCRPKKHMAWKMRSQSNPVSFHYLDLKRERDLKESEGTTSYGDEPQIGESVICVAETEARCTIVIAFVNGTYILHTLDEGYSASLYEVIQSLMNICVKAREEVEQNGQEENKVQLGF